MELKATRCEIEARTAIVSLSRPTCRNARTEKRKPQWGG